jgi:hypothetical protein
MAMAMATATATATVGAPFPDARQPGLTRFRLASPHASRSTGATSGAGPCGRSGARALERLVALARGAFDREGQGQDRGGRRRSLLRAGRSDRSNGVRPAGTALPAPARALRHAQALYLVYAAGHAAITLLRRRATWVRCAQGRIRFCRRATSGGPLPDHGLTGPRSGADHGAGPVAQAPWRRPHGLRHGARRRGAAMRHVMGAM